MGALTFLLVIVGLIVVAFGAAVVVPLLSGSQRKALTASRQREKIATAALRRIRNDAGNPSLEASIALDEIENIYTKELN